MKYVFLTNSMGGYSGGPTYVQNKLKYLKDKGWNVLAFDSTGSYNSDIKMEAFLEFKNNRYQELFYNPYWMRKSRRKKVLNEILNKIGFDDRIVIESDGLNMSIWGELIASHLGAKHIVFVLSERLTIHNPSIYQFYKYKALRGELFSISANAYRKLIQKFEDGSDAEQHYWSATITVPIENVRCDEISNIPSADYNIGHFGRQKSYFDSMFEQVSIFAKRHEGKSVNFILLGDVSIEEKCREMLPPNVHLYVVASRQPIPSVFFEKTDVVIATAGCANIGWKYGAKVISIDVYSGNPLGVLGYDTKDSNLRSKDNTYSLSLSETMDNVLVTKKYEKETSMDYPITTKGFDYQLTFAVPSDAKYYDVSKIDNTVRSKHDVLIRSLLFFNQVGVCSSMRYHGK